MNLEEIDAWYEEKKQELLNQYVKELEEKIDRKKIEQEFNAKMKKIHEQYEKLFAKSQKHVKVKKEINKFTSFMDMISDMYK